LLAALPLSDFVLGHAVENVVLVAETEQSAREPPLDRAPERRTPAPAIRFAAALVVARIVDPLD